MTTLQSIFYIAAPFAGYFVGSIPFAFLIGRSHGVDLRTVGSKNVGATNLGRAIGTKYFWIAFLLDAAKGFIPALGTALAVQAVNRQHPDLIRGWAPLLVAIACVLGHTFPVWLKFKGGKGVATSFGSLLGCWPIFTLGALGGAIVFVAVFMVWRYISLASIVGSIGFCACVITLTSWPQSPYYVHSATGDAGTIIGVSVLFMLLIVIRHRSNISRLLAGTERRWSERAQ
jgi:glycerol-3-phosphate acyltransferase PlsY